MPERTAAAVIAEVRRLVGEFPEAKYMADGGLCQYTQGIATNGQRGCLIGQAIVTLYPDLLEALREEDKGNLDPAGEVCLKLGIDVSLGEREYLDTIQYAQDRGVKWCDCLLEADRECLGV